MSEHPPQPTPPTGGSISTVARPSVLEPNEVEWTAPSVPAAAYPATGSGMGAFLHGFRRRWLLATLVGLLGGAAAGAGVWLSASPEYTATAMLRMAASRQGLVFSIDDRKGHNDFEIYKNTQQQFLRSRFVLAAALRRPASSKLAMVREQVDPIDWIARRLQVHFPGNGEIMYVGLSGEDPQEVATLVNAVVQAYLDEVVNVEQNERREKLSKLERLYTEKENELRTKRNDLIALADQLGTGDTATLSLKQQLLWQQYAELQRELLRVQSELRQTQDELRMQEAVLQDASKAQVSELDLEAFASTDATYAAMALDAERVRLRREEIVNKMATAAATPHLAACDRHLEELGDQLTRRKEQLREELKRRQLGRIEGEMKRLTTRITLLEGHEKRLHGDLQERVPKADKMGEQSIDVEIMRSEIQRLERVLESVGRERDQLRVEIGSGARTTLLQEAETPKLPNRDSAITNTAAASALGFLLPVFLVTWWDVRAKRISSPSEVSAGLGLTVLGAVPVIPSRAVTGLGKPSKSHYYWRARLSEAVNGIAAGLLRKAEREQTRVILITSATSGEGKTTLASQVAISLARTGHKTILVDFDLRRPCVDKVFGLLPTPGVSEVLRTDVDLDGAVQKPPMDNLWVVAAGHADKRTHAVLANGGPGALFRELREGYEFVVVDGSPLLSVADMRFVGQHVDGVILSVFRDVSQAPRIIAAWDVLASLGIRTLGAVVTGSGGDPYYHEPYYYYGDSHTS